MAVRTYPSQQDTNLTAKGSLLISIDAAIDNVEIYINNNIWNKRYSIINGLYSIPINIGDVIKIDSLQQYSMTLGRYDYTTDDVNGDNGIKNTAVDFIYTSNSYSFTATTLSTSYNFEYRGSISFAVATPTPTPTATPTPTPTITPTGTPTPTPTVTITPTPTVTPTFTPTPTVTPTVTPTATPPPCFNIGTGSTENIGFDEIIDIGTSYSVDEIVFQTDGKIICGGDFTKYRGVTAYNNIIRLNVDGSADSSFVTGTGFSGGTVWGLALQSDGKILCVGNFTSYSGISADGIIRLNTDGSKDTSFVYGSGFSGTTGPYAIALQSDGKIIVGGYFDNYNGTSVPRLIRLNTDGTYDSSFSYTTPNADVFAITVQSDNKVVVGGQFGTITYSGGTPTVNYIYRVNSNGSYDTTFNGGGTRFDNAVRDINIQTDGKIVVVGDFTTYNGSSSQGIVRLNTNASVDSSFNVGTGFYYTLADVEYELDIQPDGKILVVGSFQSYNGTTTGLGICRINTNGSLDTSFNTGLGLLSFNYLLGSTIKYYSYYDRIFVGGRAREYYTYGLTINHIVRIKMDGSEDICP